MSCSARRTHVRCVCVHHMCVLACGHVCVCVGGVWMHEKQQNAWSICMVLFTACGQQRAHHIENRHIVGSHEELLVTQPSPSLTLPVSGFQGKGHIELDLSVLFQSFSSFQLAPHPTPKCCSCFFFVFFF